MINIQKEDLKHMDYIGGGNFGTVFRHEDKVYKIYNDKVKTTYNDYVDNPSLKYNKRRIKRAIDVNSRLKYSDTIEDVVLIDGHFKGIVRPYYEGDVLYPSDDDMKTRLKLARKLLICAKELTDHHIYPLDYKLINIIKTKDEVKLIDLDDCLTKYSTTSNNILLLQSTTLLDKTLKLYLEPWGTLSIPPKVKKLLNITSDRVNNTYKKISKYISEKQEPHNYIFLNEEETLYDNIELLKSKYYDVIYMLNEYASYDKLEKITYELLEKGINLKSFIYEDEREDFLEHNCYLDIATVKNNSLIRTRKE